MAETPTATAARPTAAVGLMIAGGVLGAVGALLAWFRVTNGGSETLNGTDLSVGLGVLFIAALVAVAGVVAAIRAPKTGGRAWSITALVLAIFVAIIGLWSAVAPEAAITSLAAPDVGEALGVTEAQAEAALEQAFLIGQINATSQIGTWIAAVGGVLGIVGGIMGIMFARGWRSRAEPPAPPPSE